MARAATPPERSRDRERTQVEILDVATKEFAEHGYSGARVDEIAERTRTTKRMLYYYFGSKEGLFVAVLERAYAAIREAERQVDVEHLDPVAAIRALAELTFDHHEAHPDFIRLVSIENIHRGEHMGESLQAINAPAVERIERILTAGRAAGVFRRDVDSVDLHMLISSYCVFQVANRHTFGFLFGRDLGAPEHRDHLRSMIGDVVAGWLTAR